MADVCRLFIGGMPEGADRIVGIMQAYCQAPVIQHEIANHATKVEQYHKITSVCHSHCVKPI